LDGSGSIPGRENRVFSLFHSVLTGFGHTHPAVKWITRPERESEHSSPFSTDLTNGGIIQAHPHMKVDRETVAADCERRVEWSVFRMSSSCPSF
jgi:hypothetical protein